MKQVAGSIKLELAQYREMEAFSQFASDLDAATQRLLARGSRLVELLKQPQYKPLTVEEQVIVIYSGVKGYLDAIDVKMISHFEEKLLSEVRGNGQDILDAIRKDKALSADTESKLKSFMDNFAKTFV